ncbi:hypothetical protein Tco_1308892 [Tanacetum coccineum]
MKPVICKVWEDDIPKYVAADKDHNCGVGVSFCGTVSFGSDIGRGSSLSTMMRNWGGEHLCPGTNFSGQRNHMPVFLAFVGGILAEGGVLCDRLESSWFGVMLGELLRGFRMRKDRNRVQPVV